MLTTIRNVINSLPGLSFLEQRLPHAIYEFLNVDRRTFVVWFSSLAGKRDSFPRTKRSISYFDEQRLAGALH